MKEDKLLEELSALEHEQWWCWALHLMQTEPGISKERINRWKNSMIPYSKLSEVNKEHDRIWACRALKIMEG